MLNIAVVGSAVAVAVKNIPRIDEPFLTLETVDPSLFLLSANGQPEAIFSAENVGKHFLWVSS